MKLDLEELQQTLPEWQHYYNWQRAHGSLKGKTPLEKVCDLLEVTPLHQDVSDAYDQKKERIQLANYQLDLQVRKLKTMSVNRTNNGQISIRQQSDYRHSDRAPAPPVLCLCLCLDVEPLPFIVGSSSLPDSAHSAIATNRLRAAVAFAHGARPFRCRALPAAAEPCLSAWPSLGIDRQRTVKRCSDVEIAD